MVFRLLWRLLIMVRRKNRRFYRGVSLDASSKGVALQRLRTSESGFSLIEGLVAVALLMLIVIGVIPMFTQAMVSNAAGRHLTQVSNIATDGFETFLQMPLNNDLLVVPVGSQGVATIQLFGGRTPKDTSDADLPSNNLLASFTTGLSGVGAPDTDLLISDAQSDAGSGFTVANLQQAEWLRQIVVRQYQISSLSDGIVSEEDLELEEADQLAGGASLGNIHLKEVEITITPRGRSAQLSLGRGKITSTVLKSF